MTVRAADRERWAKHAAPQAIALELKDAAANVDAAQRYLEWVREVRDRRAGEVARGEWPPPQERFGAVDWCYECLAPASDCPEVAGVRAVYLPEAE